MTQKRKRPGWMRAIVTVLLAGMLLFAGGCSRAELYRLYEGSPLSEEERAFAQQFFGVRLPQEAEAIWWVDEPGRSVLPTGEGPDIDEDLLRDYYRDFSARNISLLLLVGKEDVDGLFLDSAYVLEEDTNCEAELRLWYSPDLVSRVYRKGGAAENTVVLPDGTSARLQAFRLWDCAVFKPYRGKAAVHLSSYITPEDLEGFDTLDFGDFG